MRNAAARSVVFAVCAAGALGAVFSGLGEGRALADQPSAAAPELPDTAAEAAAAAPAAPPAASGVPAAPEPPAAAPEPPTTAELPKRFAPLKRPSLLHTDQFGIAILPGTGYRIIFPYKENVLCEVPDGAMIRRVCTRRVPTFLDAQLSFGLSRHWDVMLDLRFGLEKDFGLVHQLAVSPGFRYWVDPELHAKFFATIQMVIDTTTQKPTISDADFGVRNSNGFMYDVMRNVGVYLQFGETIGFRQWLRFEVDGGVGVQVRFP